MKLLKFYTDCCPQCKQQSRILESINGVEIEGVNCEDSPELVQKYQVKGLPSLVLVDDNEELIKRMTGIITAKVIQDIIDTEKKDI